MYTFFGKRIGSDLFLIEGREFKHLKVRRIKKGEEIGVICENALYRCKLQSVSDRDAKCKVLERVHVETPFVELTLIQGIPLNLKVFEFIIQKATELGVVRLIPLITKRSFRKEKVIKEKGDRFKKIVMEAMKQSNRPYPMEISDPVYIEDLQPKSELSLVLDNFGEGKNLTDLPIRKNASVEMVVGPEGGFTVEEGKILREKGYVPVRLKPNILRTETASIVGIGIIVNLAGS